MTKEPYLKWVHTIDNPRTQMWKLISSTGQKNGTPGLAYIETSCMFTTDTRYRTELMGHAEEIRYFGKDSEEAMAAQRRSDKKALRLKAHALLKQMGLKPA